MAPLFLALAAAGVAAAPADPAFTQAMRDLHKQVVDAIRNCGGSDPDIASGGAIVVCPRDAGYARGEAMRVPKLVKPKPPESDSPVHFDLGPPPPPPR